MTFAPAVTTVFVLGIFWKRGTKQAAMTTLYFGSLVGIVYFLVDLPSIGKMILGSSALVGADGSAHAFSGLVTDPIKGIGIPFMLVGPILVVVCSVIYIVTSLMTPAMAPAEVSKVCWDHPLAFLKGTITGASDPRIVTLVLIAIVTVLYAWLH